jgi:hypothetical protein
LLSISALCACPKPGQGRRAGGLSLRCGFRGAVAAAVPVRQFTDDPTLLRGLIGLAEEPGRWQSDPRFAALAPYAARACTEEGLSLPLAPGRYYLLVGETGGGLYGGLIENGLRRKITISPGEWEALSIGLDDLSYRWEGL